MTYFDNLEFVRKTLGSSDMNPPDTEEKAIRFGCGFVFGGAAFAVGSIVSFSNGYTFLAMLFFAGAGCGLLAMHFGDAFWKYVARHSHWWW